MTVTEIVLIPLHAGEELERPDSNSSKIWVGSLATVQDQPGFQCSYWGRQVENPGTLQWVIGKSCPSTKEHQHPQRANLRSPERRHTDWEFLEAHEAFMSSPAYGPFVHHLSAMTTGPSTPIHVSFAGPFGLPARAPVTELATFYFPSSFSNADFDDAASKFVRVLEDKAEGFRGAVGGWVVEEVEREGIEDGRAKAYVLAIGWDSVDAHMKYRETQAFKESVGGLREQSTNSEMHHVSFTKQDKVG